MKLKKGKKPLFNLIYSILINNLKMLKEYIKKNLKKSYIQKLILLIRSSILFIFKKNNIKRFCIDYQKFNTITIKD